MTLLRGSDDIACLSWWERLCLALRRVRWTHDAVTGERLGVKPWRGRLYVIVRMR